jgi:hypothetical protein
MKDANDDDGVGKRPVVDGVGTVKGHAQAGCEVIAGSAGKGEMSKRLEGRFDGADKTVRDMLGSFRRQRGPYLGEIGFGGVGQSERERLANSFLPRSMIRAASKS